MKKIYLLILLNSLFINVESQNFEWAKREGLWAYDYGYGITTDNSGNIYVAGKYEMNANFSDTILPDQGNHDSYLAKYNPSGNLSWVRTSGGPLGEYATAVSCDGDSFVYIGGEIEGYGTTIIFVGTSVTLNCMGANDIFLAKYDLDGNLIWAKRAGSVYNEKALGITYDSFGNVYICGFFNEEATFGGTTTISGSGMNDVFIAKYDRDGNFLWVKQAGSSGRDEAKFIKCDADGNVYICGLYSDGIDFGSQILSSPNGYYNAFFAKYAPDGTLLWVKTAGGNYDDVAWSLAIDNSGNIYITGEFNSYAFFDTLSLTTVGHADVFIACYEASGNIKWVKKGGGTLIDRARGIGSDGNNIYITGQFGGTASFGSYNVTAADSSDIFIAGLNNSGDFIWAKSVGGAADVFEPLGYECGNAICAEASGNVYATGSLLNGGVFGSTTYGAYDRTDIFVAKISQLGANIRENHNPQNIHIYPNPGSGNFTLEMTQVLHQKIEITIFNSLGQVINKETYQPSDKINIDLPMQEKGIYSVEVKSGQAIFREKIVLE